MGGITSVRQKSIDLRGRRRQAGQIERHSTQPVLAAGRRRRAQTFLFEPREHEAIQRTRRPTTVLHVWQSDRVRERLKRPVRLVLGALGNPTAKDFDFFRVQMQIGPGRRHPLVAGSGDLRNHFARGRFARNNGAFGNGRFTKIETQARFSRPFIRPMTEKATIRKDRPHVKVVIHFRQRRGSAHGRGRDQYYRDRPMRQPPGAMAPGHSPLLRFRPASVENSGGKFERDHFIN